MVCEYLQVDSPGTRKKEAGADEIEGVHYSDSKMLKRWSRSQEILMKKDKDKGSF